jgi:5-methylcytosine-specific restriction enzyme subunit McrC
MSAYELREWETLPIGDEEGGIPRRLASKLLATARVSEFSGGGSGVLEDRGQYLRARGIVGVISTEGCSLEILPKIDIPREDNPEREKAAIRRRLVHMLAVALDLKIETGRITDLAWQRETLLEILIRIFCEKLTEAVRRGMPRRYLGHEDDLQALRGSLNVSRQFTRHAVNPSKLACRFDELSQDIALNRIMKTTVMHLYRVSRNLANQQQLRELAFVYSEITDVPPLALKWGEVVIDRTNRAWQELLEMAALFLKHQYQTTRSGAGRGTALLFEMNTLFEEYVGRLVVRALSGAECRVALQGGRKFCLTSIDDGRKVFQTKPDILIWRAGKVTHVIDTKWKQVSDRIDDPKQGVSQADVYQMMAYAHLYGVPRLTLLYPHHERLKRDEGVLAQYWVCDQETVLETATLDVADGRDIVARIRTRLLASTAGCRHLSSEDSRSASQPPRAFDYRPVRL